MNVIICVIGIGSWYSRGIARMIERFNIVSPGYKIQAWVNCYPPGSPGPVIVDGYDYGPYCAKPFALDYARQSGATQAILLDAAFFPIRSIQPMVEHIQRNGYYLCANGFSVGEWCSDAALEAMYVSRESAFEMPEVSSYCVGVDFNSLQAYAMLDTWKRTAWSQNIFPGHHTAGSQGRNPGFVSTDQRVKGHRHDQSALSIIAHGLKMTELSTRPYLTAYHEGYGGAFPSESTVLVNHGVIDGWMGGKDIAG